MNKEHNEKNMKRSGAVATIGLVFGAGIGMLFGLVLGGSAIGLAMGILFGGGIGLVFGRTFKSS